MRNQARGQPDTSRFLPYRTELRFCPQGDLATLRSLTRSLGSGPQITSSPCLIQARPSVAPTDPAPMIAIRMNTSWFRARTTKRFQLHQKQAPKWRPETPAGIALPWPKIRAGRRSCFCGMPLLFVVHRMWEGLEPTTSGYDWGNYLQPKPPQGMISRNARPDRDPRARRPLKEGKKIGGHNTLIQFINPPPVSVGLPRKLPEVYAPWKRTAILSPTAGDEKQPFPTPRCGARQMTAAARNGKVLPSSRSARRGDRTTA